ncbi:hypothetical protein TI05_16475, partial [Achromatium sp. WMS3]
MGRECWQALKNFQEEAAQEERIMQLEQAAALTPTEARDIAQAVIAELRRNGQQIASDQAEAVQDIISVMPDQIRERTRATLDHAQRLGTQAIAALPVTDRFAIDEREAFYSGLYPRRRPQFRVGEPIPHYGFEWRLERLLGTGGFGEVWLAKHRRLRSKPMMAVKFCQDETSSKLLKKEEAILDKLIEQLPETMPNIVSLLELNLTEMPYWLAFEYIEGGTLESRIRLGAMDWPTAWSLFEPILQGMAAVHDLGIVHRDLKPANILLDIEQQPAIADFGIGKLLATKTAATQRSQRSQSLTTRGYGSVGYMSPEQKAAIDAHATDDVYALGIILWQMLMGTCLQSPEYPDDIADLVVPDPVKLVLSKCRFSRREKRPQNAGAMLQQLGGIQAQAAVKPDAASSTVTSRIQRILPGNATANSQSQSQSQGQSSQSQNQSQNQSQGQS